MVPNTASGVKAMYTCYRKFYYDPRGGSWVKGVRAEISGPTASAMFNGTTEEYTVDGRRKALYTAPSLEEFMKALRQAGIIIETVRIVDYEHDPTGYNREDIVAEWRVIE